MIEAEQTLKSQQDTVKQQVFWVFGIAIGGLVILAFGVYWVQRKQVLQPLRQLRDGFAFLIESNELKNITVNNPKTEVGEIAQYFNQLIERQRLEAQERANMLNVVSQFMQQMSEHLHTIGQKSNASYQQVNHNEELLLNIQQLGEQVNHINAQAAENAQSTYEAMQQSVGFAKSMLNASSDTQQRIEQGMHSVQELLSGVQGVSNIITVIRTIAAARIMMPASHVRLSAGREEMNEQMHALAYLAGANSIFYGEKLLTTPNPRANADMALFARLGIEPERRHVEKAPEIPSPRDRQKSRMPSSA